MGLPILYTAPYANVHKTTTFASDLSGCASISSKSQHWFGLTGALTWGGRTAAHSCPSVIGTLGFGSHAVDSTDVTIELPIQALPGASTATTITVDWTVTLGANATIHVGGACPAVMINPTNGSGDSFCYVGATASLDGVAYLEDETNGSVFYAANYWTGLAAVDQAYNETSCTSFRCSNLNYTYTASNVGASPATVTWWINATLNHSHAYEAVTELSANISAESIGYPASRAVALLDFASLTRGAVLSWVKVS